MSRREARMHWHRQHDWHVADEAAMFDRMARFIENDLDLTARQQPAWRRLIADAKVALPQAREARGDLPGQPSASAPEQLAALRERMTAGLAALDSVEPAFAAFYALLDPQQRSRIDAAVAGSQRW